METVGCIDTTLAEQQLALGENKYRSPTKWDSASSIFKSALKFRNLCARTFMDEAENSNMIFLLRIAGRGRPRQEGHRCLRPRPSPPELPQDPAAVRCRFHLN